MMNSLAFATIEELKALIVRKEVSHQELLTFFLRRFEVFDKDLKSALEVFDKDSIISNAVLGGNIGGIPGIIKDNICHENRIASCASKMLEHFVSPYNATAVDRLKKNGGLIVGRANMDEFAMGSSTETSAFQKTCNPWDMSRVPGGSSGGSAAAVAAGLVPWALGSDTGGSVRQPAAFCGIVGLKPTYGLVSRHGLIAYASSFDQIGVFSRTVRDNATILSTIAGNDPKDSSSLQVKAQDYTSGLETSLPHGLRIGVIENVLHADGMDAEVISSVTEALCVFKNLGAHIEHIKLPSLEYSAAAYFILSRAEAASNLARFDGVRYGLRDKKAKTLTSMYCNTRHDGFGDEVRSRIMVGNYVLSAGHSGEFYANAKRVQQLIRSEFVEAFKSVDVLIMPTQPAPAFKFGAFDVDKLQLDLQDYFTCPMNIAGIPALSLPCGYTQSKLPIGFQIVGPHLSEHMLYKIAHVYESVTEWHKQHPSGF